MQAASYEASASVASPGVGLALGLRLGLGLGLGLALGLGLGLELGLGLGLGLGLELASVASPARSCRLAACRCTRWGLEVPATARRKASRKVWSEPWACGA